MSTLTVRPGERLARWRIRARVRAMHSSRMNTSTPAAELYPVAEQDETIEAARSAAYRRLTAVVLGLDVATLAFELRATRLRDDDFALAA